jgi:hypothetical protein
VCVRGLCIMFGICGMDGMRVVSDMRVCVRGK